MKKLFTFLLALVASVGIASAQSGTCGDNLTWTLSNGTLTISGTGAMADYSIYKDTPWYDYRSSIKSVIINDGVTSIGNHAFGDCSSLTSITIPNSVTSIGEWVFNGCSSLTSITIPNSVTSIREAAFLYCGSLTSINVDSNNPNYSSVDGVLFNKDKTTLVAYPVGKQGAYTIPNSVTSIGDVAFCWCDYLTSITIPNSVTSIGNGAFYECSSLTSITIPNSVTSIGDEAFRSCYRLTYVTIPNSVTSIANRAFYFCASLTSVTINSDAIVNKAYTSFDNLSDIFGSQVTEYIIGDNVKGIGEYAFYECSSLTSITIPNSVTGIGEGAFYECSSLTSVTINSDAIVNKAYTSSSNLSNIFGSQVTKYIIGDNVKGIGEYAFYGCSSLKSITIPNSVKSIGEYAFRGTGIYDNDDNWENDVLYINDCLIEVDEFISGAYKIKEGTRLIANSAFSYCSSLTSVTIPNSVTSIGSSAFEGCSNITSVTWNAKNCHSYNFGSQVTSFEFGNEVEVVPSSLCKGMEKLTSVTIPNSVKTIGTSAFKGCIRLGKVSLGKNLETIGANAFAECTRLYDIYVYATYPPFAEESSFANYNVYVYIPCEYKRDYILDVVWGKFKFIECISSDNVTTDEIVVTPSENEANVIWPSVTGAATYELVIKDKDGNIVCTLIFNANGQLTSIAFNAPSRNGAPAQTQNAGFSFTITGLDSGTGYDLTLTAKNNSGNTIEETTIPFHTDYPEGIEDIPSSSLQGGDRGRLILRDGQVLILRNDKTYTMQGMEVK